MRVLRACLRWMCGFSKAVVAAYNRAGGVRSRGGKSKQTSSCARWRGRTSWPSSRPVVPPTPPLLGPACLVLSAAHCCPPVVHARHAQTGWSGCETAQLALSGWSCAHHMCDLQASKQLGVEPEELGEPEAMEFLSKTLTNECA